MHSFGLPTWIDCTTKFRRVARLSSCHRPTRRGERARRVFATQMETSSSSPQNQGTRMWPNHALQRTAAGRRRCSRRAPWPPSLSLGRSATKAGAVIAIVALALTACGPTLQGQTNTRIEEFRRDFPVGLSLAEAEARVQGRRLPYTLLEQRRCAEDAKITHPTYQPKGGVCIFAL